MIKVLCVDDNLDRVRSISSIMPKDKVLFDYVTTKNEAMRKFGIERIDLAIIDIMLPDNLDSDTPNKKGGIELIEQLPKRNVHPPEHIIGVTSDDETYQDNVNFFIDRLFPIIKWNSVNNSNWGKSITDYVNYLYSVHTKEQREFIVDIAIITAVEEEFNAVKDSFIDWKEIKLSNDPNIYFLSNIIVNEGVTQSILLSVLPEMGLTAAANLTTRIIDKFHPSKVLMAGICGGVKKMVQIGDLIIASNSWDYGSGKIKPAKEKNGHYYSFEASPNQISVSNLNALKLSTSGIIEKITNEWNKFHMDMPMNPKLHIGPMPSGASVICDPELFNEIIRPQHRKCLALDMETYGVYYSSANTTQSPIRFLSIKSVSDYADEEKNDKYHSFCCYLSASFLKECIYNNLI